MESQKGTFLSALIVSFGLAIITASVFLIIDRGMRNALGILPGWFNFYVIILLLARLIALISIWNYKRWGVYILFLLECVEVSFGLFVFTNFQTLFLRAFIGVPSFFVLILIWYLGLRSKWELFT